MCLLLVVYKKYFHVGIIIGVMLLRNSPKICFWDFEIFEFCKTQISNLNRWHWYSILIFSRSRSLRNHHYNNEQPNSTRHQWNQFSPRTSTTHKHRWFGLVRNHAALSFHHCWFSQRRIHQDRTYSKLRAIESKANHTNTCHRTKFCHCFTGSHGITTA